jgi:hypothetical protein
MKTKSHLNLFNPNESEVVSKIHRSVMNCQYKSTNNITCPFFP